MRTILNEVDYVAHVNMVEIILEERIIFAYKEQNCIQGNLVVIDFMFLVVNYRKAEEIFYEEVRYTVVY